MNEDLIGNFIQKKCPKCGASLLGNKVGDEWCSLITCDYNKEEPKLGDPDYQSGHSIDANGNCNMGCC